MLREWRINKGKIDLTKVHCVIITDKYEESFDQSFGLEKIECVSKTENIGDHLGFIANGKFKRNEFCISLEEIRKANGMSKKELNDLLAEQQKGEEENRPILVEYDED